MPRTKAAIPAANFVPPSRLNGLVLSIQDPDGDLVIDFAAMRGPKNLVQETAEAFAYLTGDLGPWHSAMTARTSLDGIRAFLKWAVDRKVLRCYAELTPAVWNRWRTYCANTYSPATAGAYLPGSARGPGRSRSAGTNEGGHSLADGVPGAGPALPYVGSVPRDPASRLRGRASGP